MCFCVSGEECEAVCVCVSDVCVCVCVCILVCACVCSCESKNLCYPSTCDADVIIASDPPTGPSLPTPHSIFSPPAPEPRDNIRCNGDADLRVAGNFPNVDCLTTGGETDESGRRDRGEIG